MFDELYQTATDAVAMDIARRGLPAEPVKQPGAFSEFGSYVGKSVMQGGAMAARGLGMAGAAIPILAERSYHGGRILKQAGLEDDALSSAYFDALETVTKPAVEYWKPDAANAGIASQVVGGFARIVLPLAAGGGNPTLAVAGEQVGAYDDLIAQGVDPKTANKAATVRGATTAAGMVLPAALVPGRLAAAGTGAVVNPVFGVVDRAATKAILENADYDKIAAQYDPLDGTAILIDALVGAAAGGVAGRPRVAVTPEQHAAALALNEAHVADDATLVSSNDPTARTQAIDAQTQAARSVEAGEPVMVAGRVDADPVQIEAKRAEAEQRLRDLGARDDLPEALSVESVPNAIEPPARAADEATQLDPIRQLVEANPDRIIRDDDGTEYRAADLFEQVEKEVAQVEIESRTYQAAATCFLQHGAN